jgi:hypothetical protein
MPPGGALPGQAGQSGAGTDDVTKVNSIPRRRYMHVKEQARHLPFAMRLIVDQSHVHDVLAAFANSRLRIQITQISLQQTSNVSNASPQPGAPSGMSVGAPMMPTMGSMGAGSGLGMGYGPGAGGSSGMNPAMMMVGSAPPGGRGGMPGGRMPGLPGVGSGGSGTPKLPGSPGGPGPDGVPGKEKPSDTPAAQDTARLVELALYGVATLYERFPPRKKPDEAPAAPGAAPAPGR